MTVADRVRWWIDRIAAAVAAPAGFFGLFGLARNDLGLVALSGMVCSAMFYLHTLPLIRGFWRAEPQPQPAWTESETGTEGWESTERLAPTMGLLFPPALASGFWLLGLLAADWPVTPSDVGSWHPVLVVVPGLFIAAYVFLAVTVTLFNWPRFVVPPALRDQYGYIRVWDRA